MGRVKAQSKLMSAKDVAEYLQVSINYLAKLRMRAKGPKFYKLGWTVIYTEQDVIDWVRQNRVK